jgi:hypothetical protein
VRPDKTELEWSYEPPDYFEAPYDSTETGFRLHVSDGCAMVALHSPQDPIDAHLSSRIRTCVADVFAIREFQTHRSFTLTGPSIRQHRGDQQVVSVQVSGSAMALSSTSVDFVVLDSRGNVVRDTKAERIAGDKAMLDDLAPKLARSSELRELVESYSRAVNDPTDELVHLYEIRDGLVRRYGSEVAARRALGIVRGEWNRLGTLANVEPLQEGRHRGKHPGAKRPATEAELVEVRSIARAWIMAFAATI